MVTIVTHLKPKERKIVQASIDTLIGCRQKEIDIFERNIMKPLKDAIETLKDAKKGRQSLDVTLCMNRCVTKHIRKFIASGSRYREGVK